MSLAVDVDGGVVPGGYYAACLLLGWVPGGSDVGVWAGEDDEGFGGGVALLPLEIGSGDVAEDGAVGTSVLVEQDGQVGCDEAGCSDGDEGGQGVVTHVGVEDGEVVDAEVFWCVHGRLCGGDCNF